MKVRIGAVISNLSDATISAPLRNEVAADTFRLLIMESDEPVRTLTLRAAADKRVTFGRQDSNVVQLRSMLVSREHGWFERVGGQWYVCEREGVANPLRVNGQPLTRIAYNGQAVLAARLSAGDALRIDSPSGVHAEGLQAVFLSAADRVRLFTSAILGRRLQKVR